MQTYRIGNLLTIILISTTMALFLVHSRAQAQDCRPKSSGSCSPKNTETASVKQVQPQISLDPSSNSTCSKASGGCPPQVQSAALAGVAGRVDLGASGNGCATTTQSSRSAMLQAYFEEVLRSEEDFPADFKLLNCHGDALRFAKYTGRPFVVAFLCSHSRRNLSALSQLANKYVRDDLALVPVAIFDGSQEDLRELHALSKESDFCDELLIHNDPAIATACRSGVVTVFLLVDRNGRLVKKMVGNQSMTVLEDELDRLVRLGAARTEITGPGAE